MQERPFYDVSCHVCRNLDWLYNLLSKTFGWANWYSAVFALFKSSRWKHFTQSWIGQMQGFYPDVACFSFFQRYIILVSFHAWWSFIFVATFQWKIWNIIQRQMNMSLVWKLYMFVCLNSWFKYIFAAAYMHNSRISNYENIKWSHDFLSHKLDKKMSLWLFRIEYWQFAHP